MTTNREGVIVSNFSFLNEKKLSVEKLSNQFSSNESLSSEQSLKEHSPSSKWSSQSSLPLKKRHGGMFEDSKVDPWIQKQQNIESKRSKTDTNILKSEDKKAAILPGVIRHTSCPENTLAYYYNYSNQ